MNTLLDQVGHQEYLYETFVDATETTFEQVIDSIQKNVPNETFLEDIFNDFSQSMSIITHFRVSVALLSSDLNSLEGSLTSRSSLPALG